jgi:hypothetical protein
LGFEEKGRPSALCPWQLACYEVWKDVLLVGQNTTGDGRALVVKEVRAELSHESKYFGIDNKQMC